MLELFPGNREKSFPGNSREIGEREFPGTSTIVVVSIAYVGVKGVVLLYQVKQFRLMSNNCYLLSDFESS